MRVVDNVLWLRGTPDVGDVSRKFFSYSSIDRLVKEVLCNETHVDSVKVVRDQDDVQETRRCQFVDFPHEALQELYLGGKSLFADKIHFVDPMIYIERNEAAMKVANIQHLVDDTINNNKIANNKNDQVEHIVYIGDDILRDQYLTYVYFLKHQELPPLHLTICSNSSWHDCFLDSVNVIGNESMTCDCYRPLNGHLSSSIENRYYQHLDGKLYLSYIQKIGDHPGELHLDVVDIVVVDDDVLLLVVVVQQ